jgi:hypothetical protein
LAKKICALCTSFVTGDRDDHGLKLAREIAVASTQVFKAIEGLDSCPKASGFE